jgi:hypothetical protein
MFSELPVKGSSSPWQTKKENSKGETGVCALYLSPDNVGISGTGKGVPKGFSHLPHSAGSS